MYNDQSVAVVIPAFNEERAITTAIESVPDFVDHIVVVDDASSDRTAEFASRPQKRSLEFIRHTDNRGVGAAIITGYRRCLREGIDIVAVMAGDGQMDPGDLPDLIKPIANNEADYAKGNRFRHPDIWKAMPRTRLVGNFVLSLATRVTSGYKDIFDSQCGYTAIHRRALLAMDLARVFPRYGYPNDVLARLHAAQMRVRDVPVRPVYGEHWSSGIKPTTVVYPITFVLLRSWSGRVIAENHRRRTLAQSAQA